MLDPSDGWNLAVRRGLEELIPGARGRIAAVDFDGTCVRGDLSETALAILAAEVGEDLVGAYDAACTVDRGTAFVGLVHTLCGGRSETEVSALALRALAEGAARGLAVRRSVRGLLHALHTHGWEILLVTASAEPIVAAAARHLGLPPHRVVGMLPALGADGRYVVAPLLRTPWREGKVRALREAVGGPPDLAIGDSADDEPMLAYARAALLLDHGDPVHAARGRDRGWLVQPERDLL